MSSTQTLMHDLRRQRDVTPVRKRWSTADGASSGTYDPNCRHEASKKPIGAAGEASDFGREQRQRRPQQIKIDGAVLTPAMAAVLLEHAGGPRPIHVVAMELRILRSLKARGLICFNRLTRPTHSIATTHGRGGIAALVARQADALAGQGVARITAG